MNGPQKERLCVFEGMISVRALVDGMKEGGGRKIVKILYAEERRARMNKEYLYLTHRAEELGFELVLSPMEELKGLAVGNSHGGVLALCTGKALPKVMREDLPEKGFFMMTEGIEDPYTFGYALRSIYAAGADGFILTGKERTGADGIVCRASAGASERMKIFSGEPEEAADLFKSAGYTVVASDTENARPVYDVDLSRPLLLIVGGEKRGITSALLKKCDATVRLDYGRPFDAALSAASAASILAFEVFRQNREKI